MALITTFLAFNDRAEEAAKFYVSIFKNSKIVKTTPYTEAGPGPAGSVMIVEFQLDGQDFIAMNGGPHFEFTTGISLSVDCQTQAEVDDYSEKLSSGGGEVGPCGWVTDKFGVSWQVTPSILPVLVADPDPAKAARAMAAMMKMKKIDIEAVKRAHAGTR